MKEIKSRNFTMKHMLLLSSALVVGLGMTFVGTVEAAAPPPPIADAPETAAELEAKAARVAATSKKTGKVLPQPAAPLAGGPSLAEQLRTKKLKKGGVEQTTSAVQDEATLSAEADAATEAETRHGVAAIGHAAAAAAHGKRAAAHKEKALAHGKAKDSITGLMKSLSAIPVDKAQASKKLWLGIGMLLDQTRDEAAKKSLSEAKNKADAINTNLDAINANKQAIAVLLAKAQQELTAAEATSTAGAVAATADQTTSIKAHGKATNDAKDAAARKDAANVKVDAHTTKTRAEEKDAAKLRATGASAKETAAGIEIDKQAKLVELNDEMTALTTKKTVLQSRASKITGKFSPVQQAAMDKIDSDIAAKQAEIDKESK